MVRSIPPAKVWYRLAWSADVLTVNRRSISSKSCLSRLEKSTLQETNISHLGKRKIIDSKVPSKGDMLVPWRALYNGETIIYLARIWVCGAREGWKKNSRFMQISSTFQPRQHSFFLGNENRSPKNIEEKLQKVQNSTKRVQSKLVLKVLLLHFKHTPSITNRLEPENSPQTEFRRTHRTKPPSVYGSKTVVFGWQRPISRIRWSEDPMGKISPKTCRMYENPETSGSLWWCKTYRFCNPTTPFIAKYQSITN